MRLVQKINYEVALRVIGQDLAALLIESLEITVDGEDFAVKGLRIACTAEALQEDKEKPWRKLLIGRRSSARRHQSIREPLVRKYKTEDIERLDEAAKSRQTDMPQIQYVLTLADSLRMIGRIVDSSGGRLIKLVKTQDNFALEYEDANGVAHKDEYSNLSLYKYQQSAMSLREPKKEKEKDPWSGRE